MFASSAVFTLLSYNSVIYEESPPHKKSGAKARKSCSSFKTAASAPMAAPMGSVWSAHAGSVAGVGSCRRLSGGKVPAALAA